MLATLKASAGVALHLASKRRGTPTSFRALQHKDFFSSSTSRMSSSPITLYYFGTPNGHAPSIMLEELKAAYGSAIPDVE